VAWFARNGLTESPRYLARRPSGGGWQQLTHRPYRSRLLAAGGALFLGSAFLGPAVELANRYLDHERIFSPSRISILLAASSIPFLPMAVIGGRLADQIGRKPVAGTSITGAALCYGGFFLTTSPWIWIWIFGPLGSSFAAPAYAAVKVYATELFPTRIRARSSAVVQAMGVAGAAMGLVLAGWFAHPSIGAGIAKLAGLGIAAAVVVAIGLPETARLELEIINDG